MRVLGAPAGTATARTARARTRRESGARHLFPGIGARPLLRLAIAAGLCGVAGSALAQAGAFPAKPVRIVVPFAAGGPVDAVGRTLGQQLSQSLGQPVLIDNRGGAGGSIGMEAMVRSAPDGYTLGIGSLGSLVLSPAINPKLPYDPIRDVTPIASVAVTHYVLAVHPAVPAKSVQELIRIARTRKGGLNYGSSGVGSISHLIAEAVQSSEAGTRLVHVAYKGVAPAIAALLGGEIDMAFVTLPQAEGPAAAGRLRLLATTGGTRAEAAKSLPTLIEAGLKVHPVEGSYGLVGPAGIPRDLVSRLNAQVNQALRSVEFRERLARQGFEAVPVNSPDEYAKQIRADLEVFGQVVRRAGIRPEI